MVQAIETADKLDKLEAESIFILREAYKNFSVYPCGYQVQDSGNDCLP